MMQKSWFKKISLLILLVLVFAAGQYLFLYHPLLNQPLLAGETYLNVPVAAVADEQGDIFVLDNSMMRIVKINAAGQAEWQVYGGENGERFYRCRDLTADAVGNIYVLNQAYEDDGRTIEKENIVKFTSDGVYQGVVVEHSYAGETEKPELYGWVLSLCCLDQTLYYTYAHRDTVDICRVTGQGREVVRSLDITDASTAITACELGPDGKSFYYINKRGTVIVDAPDGERVLLRGYGNNQQQGESFLPGDMDIDDLGRLYMAESFSGSVQRLEQKGTLTTVVPPIHELKPEEGISSGYEYVDLPQHGQAITAVNTQYISWYADGAVHSANAFPNSLGMQLHIWLAWLSAGYLLLLLFWALLLLARWIWRRGLSPSGQAIFTAFVMSAAVLGVVGGVMLSRQYELLNQQISGQIYSLLVMASRTIDTDALARYQSYEDYGNADFRRLRSNIEALRESVPAGRSSMFFVLYKTDGQYLYQVFDSPDTNSPLSLKYKDYAATRFAKAADTGSIQLQRKEWTSIGVWTSGIVPLYAADHSLAGFAEIGINAKAKYDAQLRYLIELGLLVLGGTAAILIFFTQVVHLIAVLRTKRLPSVQGTAAHLADMVRPMAFALFLGHYMQMAFAPIYASKMPDPFGFLSPGMAAAVAMAAQVIATGLSGFFATFLQARLGTRRELLGGGLLAVAGFAICGWQAELLSYIGGKILIGSGLGFIGVASDTLVSMIPFQEKKEAGFAHYYSGRFSAVTVGSVLGGLLATLLGYELTYLVTSGVMLLACVLTAILYRPEDTLPAETKKAAVLEPCSMGNFLLNRRTMAFLGCLYVPYLVMSYFEDYMFPLFAYSMGWSEAWIGQMLMVNGMAVVYLGPVIPKYLLGRVSTGEAALLGNLLNILALAFFAMDPSMLRAALVLVVMGCADSFSYAMQVCYFNELPLVPRCNMAYGVKNAAENMAYTAAPFAYGGALLLGTGTGITVMFGIAAVLLVLFGIQLEPLRQRSSLLQKKLWPW